MAKFVNIQVPLIELSSDSDRESAAPPRAATSAPTPAPITGPPAASPPRASPRTPRIHPTVSDDETSDSPAVVPSISRHSSPRPPVRAPTPRPHPPRVSGPVPPYERPHPPAPSTRYQGHTSLRPLLPHQMIHRPYPGPFPHHTYEHGESSRQATYDRRIDRLAADTQDARYSCQRLRETQVSVQRRLAAFEEVMARWRRTVDTQAQAMTVRLQRVQLEYLHRTARMERFVTGVLAMVLGAAIVAFMPWFYPRG